MKTEIKKELQRLNFEYLEAWIDFVESNDYHFNDVEECLNAIKTSFKKCYIGKFTRPKNTIQRDGLLYDGNWYVITIQDKVVYSDDAYYCYINEAYTTDAVEVYIRPDVTAYVDRDTAEIECIYFEETDRWYLNDRVAELCGLIYFDGEWMTNEQYLELTEGELYHDRSFCSELNFKGKEKVRFGIEIEKVDEDILIKNFKSTLPDGFARITDASLPEGSGYELVTPIIEGDVERIRNYFEQNEILLKHINARYDERCGGHITVSAQDVTNFDMYYRLYRYAPVLAAMYPSRAKSRFCTVKVTYDPQVSSKEYFISLRDKDEHLGGGVELRIFPAVKNLDTLIWRLEFVKMMASYKSFDIKDAFLNLGKKRFAKVMRKQYDFDKMKSMLERALEFAQQEGFVVSLNDREINKILEAYK